MAFTFSNYDATVTRLKRTVKWQLHGWVCRVTFQVWVVTNSPAQIWWLAYDIRLRVFQQSCRSYDAAARLNVFSQTAAGNRLAASQQSQCNREPHESTGKLNLPLAMSRQRLMLVFAANDDHCRYWTNARQTAAPALHQLLVHFHYDAWAH